MLLPLRVKNIIKFKGEVMFISDINVPGMLHAVLIRSNVRSGKLLDIQLPKMPDGYFFFSAVDIPGKNSIWNYETLPVFASYEISYLGEPVGVIAGAVTPPSPSASRPPRECGTTS